VSVRLADTGVRAVLLDIEGTTTPIAFVHQVLFGYARAHIATWLADVGPDATRPIVAALRVEYEADRLTGEGSLPLWRPSTTEGDNPSATAYALWLMDRDRKSPALKRLQGLVWERGYQAGDLRGEIFEDVAPALERWHQSGVSVAIYSSGSELAQRRLFESTSAGDLTPFIARFFDTAIGSKVSSASYERIAAALGRSPSQILFVSDVTAELRAAAHAGCPVQLSLRHGNPPQADAAEFSSIRTFDEIA
jgi:enolase-phosphatase E1